MITEKACAKLNISLDVSKPRPDGYHDMIMVMQAVSLCDDIEIEINSSGKVFAKSNLKYIPSDEKNLAVKAAGLYFEALDNRSAGAVISIRKAIPVGAGMAGGSTDAAAVIRALNRYYGNALSPEELLKVAERTGSDVPFCVLGGTALAEGRGEILTSLPEIPECTFVICKPEFSISTPELFKALDRIKLRSHPDTAGIISALENGDLKQICRRLYNVFEDVPDRRMRTVTEIKQKLLSGGAEGAVMTGTGSAVFGIFTDAEEAYAVCSQLEKDYGFCVCAEPVGKQI
ncbi:MAG: 4-(cytidine 5'-diphospho)-2-C-methyl-D-erythritol kinase [Eubacteriales bacterium]|nr:4-(cytidine 5'-diphospho)-2-C-methyl-D-erythritol kinase [Eubacteriales bacterium]